MNWIDVGTFIIIVSLFTFNYVSMYIHEMEHFLTGKLLKAKKAAITKGRETRFIASFQFNRKLTKIENFLLTISGLLVQLVFFQICILQTFSPELRIIAIIYLPNLLVNILPFHPLDGYHLKEIVESPNAKLLSENLFILIFLCGYFFSLLIALYSIFISSIILLNTTLLLGIAIQFWVKSTKKYLRYFRKRETRNEQ